MARQNAAIRHKRVAGRIQQILGELIQFEVSDPRVSLLTITEVRVDRELEYANVWVCTLDGSSDSVDQVMEGLRSASGFLRRELAKRLQSRHTPQLKFHWDHLPEEASRINAVLDSLAPKEDPKPPQAEESADSEGQDN